MINKNAIFLNFRQRYLFSFIYANFLAKILHECVILYIIKLYLLAKVRK